MKNIFILIVLLQFIFGNVTCAAVAMSLPQIIDYALSNNIQLKISQEEIVIKQKELNATKGNYDWFVTGGLQSYESKAWDLSKAIISITKTLGENNYQGYQTRQKLQNLELALLTYKDTRDQLVYKAEAAYALFSTYSRIAEIKQQELAALEKAQRNIEERYKQGFLSQAENNWIKSRVSLLKLDIIGVRQNITNNKLSLLACALKFCAVLAKLNLLYDVLL